MHSVRTFELRPALTPALWLVVALLVATASPSGAGDWPHFGGEAGGYASDADPDGIASPAFADCRGVAWWPDGDASADRACAHRLYLAMHDLRLIALDARGDRITAFALPTAANTAAPARKSP